MSETPTPADLEPTTYTTAQPIPRDLQDDIATASTAARASVTTRNFQDALADAQREAANPSQDWEGYCQKFARTIYDVPALFGSAYAQWLGLDNEDKHAGGSPADAPLGAFLFFKGSNPYGHIDVAARAFANGTPAAWSNDLVRVGKIDKVARTAPIGAWGQNYLGYGTAINGYDLDLQRHGRPKPKQDKRYVAIDHAITRLGVALDTAKRQHDAADRKAINTEIRRLKALYAQLRHA